MSVQDNSSRQPLLPAEHDEDSHIYYVNAAAAAAAAGAASPPAGEGTAMLADARLQPLPQSMQAPKAPRRDLLAFFIFGLANNFGYVIMLSGAEDIMSNFNSNLGTGIVLLCDIIPTIIVKTTAPLYVMRLSYISRVMVTVAVALLSFFLVAFANSMAMALMGVVCASISSGLGEITFLAMCSLYHKDVVSAWSSGTGAAGAVGALSYLGLTALLSPSNTCLVMTIVPLMMAASFIYLLSRRPDKGSATTQVVMSDPYTFKQKVTLTKPLIVPYMVPMFIVYLSEYLINQGLYEHIFWKGIFIDKKTQYRVFQTLYQIGVFASRSSVNVFPIRRIYIPAFLQAANFIFLAFDTKYQFIPSIWVYFFFILYEGLLGGAVYVNTYSLVNKNVKPEHREFSMGVVCIADSFGISLAGAGAVGLNQAFKNVPARPK